MTTLDQHASAARRDPHKGVAVLVDALRADPDLAQSARDRLKVYAEMEAAGRLASCWISRTKQATLMTALAAANKPAPGVPAGDAHV